MRSGTLLKQVLVTILALPSISQARVLVQSEYDCIFKKPITIGASLTGEIGRRFPGFAEFQFVRTITDSKHRGSLAGFGQSPAHLLMERIAHVKDVYSTPSTAIMNTSDWADLGSHQIRDLLYREKTAMFDDRSVLIGVDAFYWDAIYGNCEYRGADVSYPVERAIRDLTEVARQRKMTLILGNAPYENASTITITNEELNVDFMWSPPEPECVTRINQTLRENCLVENGCYILDNKDMSERLVRGETLRLQDGSTGKLYDMRLDGVHVTQLGSMYMAEQMKLGMQKNHPPMCDPLKLPLTQEQMDAYQYELKKAVN